MSELALFGAQTLSRPLMAIQNCASVLYAIRFASEELSDDARGRALDLVAEVIEKRSDELLDFVASIDGAALERCASPRQPEPEMVVQYHARQPEPAPAVDLAEKIAA
jgi:hypothetical protein